MADRKIANVKHAEKQALDSNAIDVPPGYFRSSLFIGSISAVYLGVLASSAGFGLVAPILTTINDDIGPSTSINWCATVFTLMIAVGLTLVGRIGDVFGRRFLFIGGGLLAVIGDIICATAHSIPTLIGGMTLVGLGASTQLSFFYVTAELVPKKYRFVTNGGAYVFNLFAGFAPSVSYAAVSQTRAGWRTVFWLLLGFNALALACWVFFYFPPTFDSKHNHARKWDYVRDFDYVGSILFSGGLLLFLLGLQWGGNAYPWKSAHVIATIVVGVVSLIAFILWECFATLKEPLIPLQHLRSGGFMAAVVAAGLCASLYYALAITWPSQVAIVYTTGDLTKDGLMATVVGVGWDIGEIVSGALAKQIGWVKWQCLTALAIGGVLLAAVASCGPSDKITAVCLMTFSCFCAGYAEGLGLTITTLLAPSQANLGAICGFSGSIRFTITVIAQTIYLVVLSLRSTKLVPEYISNAALGAGAQPSSITAIITAISTGTLAKVPGITTAVTKAVSAAYVSAWADSFKTIFLTTIAFSVVGVTAAFLISNVDPLMTDELEVKIEKNRATGQDDSGQLV